MNLTRYNRLQFLKNTAYAGLGWGLSGALTPLYGAKRKEQTRVGMIGLDTSHCVAFAKLLNAPDAAPEFHGYKIVAAYPKGSTDIKSSFERIPVYTDQIRQYGVTIVSSIGELLTKVDAVLLETNDGRLHLQQALPVIAARKPLFIDKPMAASLKDAQTIFAAAAQHQVPIFSSSSTRFIQNVQEVAQGSLGRVFGADAYSPAKLEKTHPDLFWYGIHGVELLYTLMGTGCKTVMRRQTQDTELVVGDWEDGRIGTFRGTRRGKNEYGALVFGEKGNALVGPYDGYRSLLLRITDFFRTGQAPVPPKETLEVLAFMEAAEESKLKGGRPVAIQEMFQRAQTGHSGTVFKNRDKAS